MHTHAVPPAKLPLELQGPGPHPLPAWARPPGSFAAAMIALAVLSAIPLLTLARSPVFALAFALGPIVVAAAAALALVARRGQRELLRRGRAVVGRVESATRGSSFLRIEYSYASAGPRHGLFGCDARKVVRDLSFWPEPGDTAFVIVDPLDPRRSVLWGVAQPPGRQPRPPPPPAMRPVPAWVSAIVIGGLLLLIAGAVAWIATLRP